MVSGKTTWIVLLLSCSAFGLHCGRDRVRIDIKPSQDSEYSTSKLIEIEVTKAEIPKTLKVKLMKATRKFQYCLPKIESKESDLCRVIVEKFTPRKESLEKGFSLMKCPVGPECKEYECKGEDSSLCLSPGVTRFVEPREHISLNKATSLLYRTCVQNWACRLEASVVQLYLNERQQITIKSPVFGQFELLESKGFSIYSNAEGAHVNILEPIKIASSKEKLKCFVKASSKMCYDEKSRKFIPVSDLGSTCLENSCYTPLGSTEHLLFDENSNGGKVADLLDLDKLYRINQFETMQGIWDLEQANLRINQLERTVSALIESMGSSQIERLTKVLMRREVAVIQKEGGYIHATVCRGQPDEEDQLKKSFLDPSLEKKAVQNKDGKGNYTLFQRYGVSSELMPEPQFKIDSLSYSEIFHLSGPLSGNSSDGDRAGTENGVDWGSLNNWCQKIGSYTGFIIAVCFVLSLKSIVGSLFKRRRA